MTLFRCFWWENAFLSEVSRWIASKLQAYFVWPSQTFLSCLFISCLLTFENWEISSKTLYVQSLLKSRGVWCPWAYNAWGGGGRAPSLSQGDTHASVPAPPPSGFVSVRPDHSSWAAAGAHPRCGSQA